MALSFDNNLLRRQDKLYSNDMIYVTLEYDGTNRIQFPVNPDILKQTISSESVTEKINGIGEISVPQTPSLSEMTFKSFFWKAKDTISPITYIRWLKTWQKSKKYAKLVVSKLNWNMLVTCESLSYWTNAGEEDDIYFEITLKEYRKHEAKMIRMVNVKASDEDTFQKLFAPRDSDDEALYGTLESNLKLSSPRPTRDNVNKEATPYIIQTENNDTITSISRKYSSDGKSSNWNDIYQENKGTLGEIATCETFTSNIPLQTPKEWNPTKQKAQVETAKKAIKKTKLMSNIFKRLRQLNDLMRTIQNIVESIPEALEPYHTIIGKISDLMNIFTPDNCLGPLDSISQALDDMIEITEFPEEVIASLTQAKDIINGLKEDVIAFKEE